MSNRLVVLKKALQCHTPRHDPSLLCPSPLVHPIKIRNWVSLIFHEFIHQRWFTNRQPPRKFQAQEAYAAGSSFCLLSHLYQKIVLPKNIHLELKTNHGNPAQIIFDYTFVCPTSIRFCKYSMYASLLSQGICQDPSTGTTSFSFSSSKPVDTKGLWLCVDFAVVEYSGQIYSKLNVPPNWNYR